MKGETSMTEAVLRLDPELTAAVQSLLSRAVSFGVSGPSGSAEANKKLIAAEDALYEILYQRITK